MSVDVKNLSKVGLKNLIENHRKNNATGAPIFLEALAELDRREGHGLEFEKSYQIILSAAKERRFLSYKELADASGAPWSKVHYSMGRHLWQLVEYADRKNWPMLSAIVVNKPNIRTGEMESETLRGFVLAARQLGYPVTDEKDFLREQQRRVFEWAANSNEVAT